MMIRQTQIQRLEKLKQKEQQAIAKRRAAEARLSEDERKKRTRAFVCMGVLIERLLKSDSNLLPYLLPAAKKETLHNRLGLGAYWPQFMPTDEEIQASKHKNTSNPQEPSA